MKLIKNLPTILPVYDNIKNQNRFKENVKVNCLQPLFSPSNSILPFMMKIDLDSPKPSSWKLYNENGSVFNDISNNIDLLKPVNFEDSKYIYYNGEAMVFKFESIEEELNVSGNFYFGLIVDGIEYFSEIFAMHPDIKNNIFSDRFVKIEFWDEVDIEPVRYRKNFKQLIFIDTFIHSSETVIEEETEPDGYENQIPIFQKMTIKQRLSLLVPDFLKQAIESVQMHSNVFVNENNKKQGLIDRFKVTPTSEEFGSLYSLEIILETDILIKSGCNENKSIISETWN